MPGLPTDSSHLSNMSRDDMIDEYGGEVESQFAKSAYMREFFPVKTIRGTDTLMNRRVGRTRIQKVTDGVRPDAQSTPFGKTSVTVDTLVLARDNRSLLNEFQTDFNARMELAQDHGKELGKFFDQAFFIQSIKGAQMAAPANLNNAIGAGKSETLALAGDESDPDKFVAAIRKIIRRMREEEIDTEELVIAVRPTQFDVLLDNDKLVSRDWSDKNGNFAHRELFYCAGVRIFESARIPTTATPVDEHHYLSNDDNGNAYDISDTDALCKAVIMHPKSLLAGETIPLTSDVYYEKTELQWFIDSYLAFGVAPNRPDVCGAVFATT